MVIRNLFRRKLRTIFSALGVGVGISLMVAIFTISDNLLNAVTSIFNNYRGDALVIKTESEGFDSIIALDQDGRDVVTDIKTADANVEAVYPFIWANIRTLRPVGPSNQINYFGVTENSPVVRKFEPWETSRPGEPMIVDNDPNGFICGKLLFDLVNEQLPPEKKLKVGQKVSLKDLLMGELAEFFLPTDGKKFDDLSMWEKGMKANDVLKDSKINKDAALSMTDLYLRAVFTAENRFTEAALYFHHDITQQLRDIPGSTNYFVVEFKDKSDAAKDASVEALNRHFPGLNFKRSDQLMDNYPEVQTMQKFGFALSLVAALAGALGVLNTMLISVLERTREIGLLMAIGWSRRRIVMGVVQEGILVTLLGGAMGLALGFGEVVAVKEIFKLRALSPALNIDLVAQAMGLALVLGFLASLYPAWRASRLTPMDALRHE
ncbi:MAG: ABC transporter permease [Planctomycetes bacterium]|nr:ABC transporter permease [Planctomycetota bacterium]NUQ35944.1 ABC transporter permease [Planctomycetaceae bacterium]